MQKTFRLLALVVLAASFLASVAPADASFYSKPVEWAQGSGPWSGTLTVQAVLADGTPTAFENVPATGNFYLRVDCLLWLICFGNYSLTVDGSPTTPALSASGATFFGQASWHGAYGLDVDTPAMMPSTLRFGSSHADFGFLGSLTLNSPPSYLFTDLNLHSWLGAMPARWCPTEETCQRIELTTAPFLDNMSGVTWAVKHVE